MQFQSKRALAAWQHLTKDLISPVYEPSTMHIKDNWVISFAFWDIQHLTAIFIPNANEITLLSLICIVEGSYTGEIKSFVKCCHAANALFD